jgi:gliding motility-associated-like protein
MQLYRVLLFSLLLLAGAVSRSEAQYDWLATLNYKNFTLNRIGPGSFPNVSGVSSATYDQNHQRYLFLANVDTIGFVYLYTIDALTGAILSSPLCPATIHQLQLVQGLEYDNATDTLYGISGTDFCWIEPATGAVHSIGSLPNTPWPLFIASAFDTRDHWYICETSAGLAVFDAASGNIVYNWTIADSVADLKFDNATGQLYGVDVSASLSSPQFDSITLATGEKHPITALPPMYVQGSGYIGGYSYGAGNYYDVGSYTIDEQGSKYIFLATDPDTSTCVNQYLYALDIPAGAVSSKILLPFSNVSYFRPGLEPGEYIAYYCFDNLRGVLYALDWYEEFSTQGIYIEASEDSVCPGDPVYFEAEAHGQVLSASYQWVVNGQNVGSNTNQYADSSLVGGDTVYCIFTIDNGGCGVMPPFTSNPIVIRNATLDSISVSISDSVTSVCPEQVVRFTALTPNAGLSPTYQWQVDGRSTGPDSPVFSYNHWTNGDVVNCVLSSQSRCALNRTAFSDTIVMQVHALPTSMGIVASATTICSGDSVTFTASPVLNGGDSAAFQWQVDGQNTGQDLSTFITKSLSNGDQVSCILTSSLGCTAPAASLDTIVMTVNPTPVVTLVADTIITRGSSVQLDPSVTGTIVSWQWTPVAGVNDPSVAKPVATPVNTTTYQLTVSSDKGCVASGDIKIIVYTPLRMPNAFTPGAGHNALFRIPPSLSITLIGFSVFNRAGLEVFTTADAGAGWDGTFGGKPQPTGTYIWEIGYEDLLTGRPARATGTVELIR